MSFDVTCFYEKLINFEGSHEQKLYISHTHSDKLTKIGVNAGICLENN